MIPGANYPIGVCMLCGGALERALAGYRCEECGEWFPLEECGLQNKEISSIEDEPKSFFESWDKAIKTLRKRWEKA